MNKINIPPAKTIRLRNSDGEFVTINNTVKIIDGKVNGSTNWSEWRINIRRR